MIIQSFVPSAPLRPYVKKYYLATADYGDNTPDVFFADGCPEIVFNLGIDFIVEGQKDPWAKVIGQIVAPLEVQAMGKGTSFGIWFQPHGFSMLFGLPLSELTNRTVSAELIFSSDFLHLVGECLSHDRIDQLIAELNTELELRLASQFNSSKAALIEFVLSQLNRNDSADKLKALAHTCNVSPRYLQKLFLKNTGLRLKQLQRILRFQNALNQLSNHEGQDLTGIAYHTGYYDQSHFIREFKAFTHLTPSRFDTENYPINKYFMHPS